MTTYCIIDIDTTLANGDHRAALLVKNEAGQIPQESWDAFLHPDLMALDHPQQHACAVLNHLRSLGYIIVFLTGRNEKYRDVTESWLVRNMGAMEDEPVLMRGPEDVGSPASVCKLRCLTEFMEQEGQTMHSCNFWFFEDDKHVMQLWRKYGVVFQCPEAWAYMNPEVPTEQEKAWTR